MSEAVQAGKDGARSAGSAPASLTTGRAFLNPVKPDGEKEPGTMGPRVLTTGSHPGHRHTKGLDGPANRGSPAAACFSQTFRADRAAGFSTYAGPF